MNQVPKKQRKESTLTHSTAEDMFDQRKSFVQLLIAVQRLPVRPHTSIVSLLVALAYNWSGVHCAVSECQYICYIQTQVFLFFMKQQYSFFAYLAIEQQYVSMYSCIVYVLCMIFPLFSSSYSFFFFLAMYTPQVCRPLTHFLFPSSSV